MNRLLRRARTVALSLGVTVLWGAALAPSGCSTPPTCESGFFDAVGTCQLKCDPAQCPKGNLCVGNQCRLQCASHSDCALGTQACTPAKADTGLNVQVCVPTGHQPPLDPGGQLDMQGKPCQFGQAQCDSTVNGMGGATKDSDNSACPNGLECDKFACGGNPSKCSRDNAACAGLKDCNVGKCPDGTRCTVTTCEPAKCTPYTCITHGEGDPKAYCAHRGCSSDADCGGAGHWCTYARDPHSICGTMKGNSNSCGKTLEPCIDKATFGATMVEGPQCLMAKTCLLRNQCADCTTNVDCSLGDADVCVTVGKHNVCAKFCTADANCRGDQICAPAPKTCQASPRVPCTTAANCPTAGDSCADRKACIPRSGGCHADTATASKFCFACTNDLDCGDAGSTMACLLIGDQGEHGCFDVNFPDLCSKDSDCPASPGGKRGRCLDGTDFSDSAQGQPLFHHCYFPRKPLVMGTNEGYSCYP